MLPESSDMQEGGQAAADARDLVKAYHHRTKHRFERYAAGPETLDWDEQPAAFRHFEGAQRILLPLADASLPGALGAALSRPFGSVALPHPPVKVDLASIGAFLHLTLGITAWKRFGPDRWAVRANPSSGNLHPAEAYLISAGVAGLADGVYHYDPEHHMLECRARYIGQSGLAPGLHIALASVMWREAWKYGERAFRYCQLDTGHAMGALRYAAAALGWQLVAHPEIDQDVLGTALGLDRLQDFPARRIQETELEETEILMCLGSADFPAQPPEARALLAASSGALWMGQASAIDLHPMYRWPVIGEIARLTRDAMPQARRQIGLPLPHPGACSGEGATFASLALTRRSAQHFDPASQMSRQDFLHIMGRLMPTDFAPWDVLPAIWDMDLVVFVHRVETLGSGVYLLSRGEPANGLRRRIETHHVLSPVPGLPPGLHLARIEALEAPALQRLARSLHCHQDIAAHAHFALGMLCPFEDALGASPAAYRELHRQAGLLGQVLYLEAEALGLRGTGIGCYFDDAVHELLGLEDSAWQSMYHFTVGKPRVDARIETLAAYAERAEYATAPLPAGEADNLAGMATLSAQGDPS
ncbi:SagB family peptide dehydrogenase [Uliginosibacterium paludis]|uniref:SagB family peptide dehydrogenase n=1 Tax=Uliginosibacterium paludis TaxID=1615952 RepID=A0ABV2CLJ4_9RHOO